MISALAKISYFMICSFHFLIFFLFGVSCWAHDSTCDKVHLVPLALLARLDLLVEFVATSLGDGGGQYEILKFHIDIGTKIRSKTCFSHNFFSQSISGANSGAIYHKLLA